mmetsp:Transcript_96466/g.268059  ORF Transcript_96466/g.268059 Transcript_96466/m.268059 type:complete len:529 (+) Transcript_96466:83-1669(+)
MGQLELDQLTSAGVHAGPETGVTFLTQFKPGPDCERRIWCAVGKLLDRAARREALGVAWAAWVRTVAGEQQQRRNALFDAMGVQLRSAQRRCGLEEQSAKHTLLLQSLAAWRGEVCSRCTRRHWVRAFDWACGCRLLDSADLVWRVLLAWHRSLCRARVIEFLEGPSNESGKERRTAMVGLPLKVHCSLQMTTSRGYMQSSMRRSASAGLSGALEPAIQRQPDVHGPALHRPDGSCARSPPEPTERRTAQQGSPPSSHTVPGRPVSASRAASPAQDAAVDPVSAPAGVGTIVMGSPARRAMSAGVGLAAAGHPATRILTRDEQCAGLPMGIAPSVCSSGCSRCTPGSPNASCNEDHGTALVLPSDSSVQSSPRVASTPRWSDIVVQEAGCTLPRGPERFFYDLASYTGCAKYGGLQAPDRRCHVVMATVGAPAPRGTARDLKPRPDSNARVRPGSGGSSARTPCAGGGACGGSRTPCAGGARTPCSGGGGARTPGAGGGCGSSVQAACGSAAAGPSPGSLAGIDRRRR